jgi:hypothetical protein
LALTGRRLRFGLLAQASLAQLSRARRRIARSHMRCRGLIRPPRPRTTRRAVSLPLARTASRPRQSMPAAWRPHAGDAGRVAPGGPLSRTRSPAFKSTATSPSPFVFSPSLPLSCPRPHPHGSAARELTGIAVPATASHHRRLNLAPSSVSSSRSPCSHQFPVVRPPSTGIARRSMAELKGDFRSVVHSSLLHLFPFLHAHLARLDSSVLEHPSGDRIGVEDGRPATTCATVPPWTAVTGPPSSVGHRVCAIEFARSRWPAW